MRSYISEKRLGIISAIVIFFCAALLGVETYFRSDAFALKVFEVADVIIIAYFSIEIIYRLLYREYPLSTFPAALKRKVFQVKNEEIEANPEDGEIIESWFWIMFDLLLVILGYLSFLRHYLDHPQTILLLRMFRIFRILRVFEFNRSLKSIERKIFSVIPTVITFFILIGLIIYVYAIMGMYLYDFRKFDTLDFSDLHASITSVFNMMANGWGDILTELKTEVPNVSIWVTEAYLISFYIFTVLITLNVFIAVMTTQIHEKLEDDIHNISEKENEILKEEVKSATAQIELDKKLDRILNELEEVRNQIKKGSN
uniref:ion transporter n=1 Tax=Flavobacterium sp. TaxID=239 RepID=UPI00404B2458